MNFWQKLPRPFFCLAPMADVTDAAFRAIIAKYGKPSVMFTEFTSADGLCSIGREKLLINLKYVEAERPIVAQIFTAKPDKMFEAAKLVKKLGFDGFDINMGCPDRGVEKQGAGAVLIKNPKLALELIAAARAGADGLPISVKTRLGYNKFEIETWLSQLLQQNLAALSIHLRTRKEMSSVPAHWELMPQIIELRNKIAPETLIIGNGGVLDLMDAKKKVAESGCDGVMLGKGIFGNPFLFSQNKNAPSKVEGRLQVMLEHTKLFEKILGQHKNFAIMKKHFKAYLSGFEGAKELRMELMKTTKAKEVEKIIKNFLNFNHKYGFDRFG